MSKRAEELAERYADRQLAIVDKELFDSNYSRDTKMGTHLFEGSDIEEAYLSGYEQAEKDLALTCEDIQLIIQLGEDVMTEAGGTPKDYNEEILRRFNEQKNRQ